MLPRGVKKNLSGIIAAVLIAVLAVGTVSVPTARAQAKGAAPPYFAIKGARIVTVSGGVIENGTVVVANGLIAAVGANATIPPEAWVIDEMLGKKSAALVLNWPTLAHGRRSFPKLLGARYFVPLPPHEDLASSLIASRPIAGAGQVCLQVLNLWQIPSSCRCCFFRPVSFNIAE